MDDIIDLLSDNSNDKNETINVGSDDEDLKTDLSIILKKYENFQGLAPKKISNNISPSSSEDELETIKNNIKLRDVSPIESSNQSRRLSPEKNCHSPLPSIEILAPLENNFDHNNEEIINEKPKRKRKSQDNQEKQLEKIRKQQEKIQKREERERLKAAQAEAKAQKLALAAAYKNIKPEECIKFITAFIDADLMSAEYGAEIPLSLQTAEVKFKIKSQVIPNIITWVRDTQAQLIELNGQLGLTNEKDECDELILILPWNEFIEYVHKKSLCEEITAKYSLLADKKISLGVYGLENYYRFHKNKKVPGKKYADAPKVSKKDVEMALIELQILMGISVRMLETSKDIGNMIAQFTKSIAQAPYKLQKQQKYEQMDWYVPGSNKDCVKVDKNGNGLMRLWRQQLTQFSLARLETAEAICTKYPSPASLMKAYDKCSTKIDGEKLLQDLPIRRAAGPLTSVRKLGPELSKKVYNLFTSLDGNTPV